MGRSSGCSYAEIQSEVVNSASARFSDELLREMLGQVVSRVFMVAGSDLWSGTRGRSRVAFARQVAMYLCKALTHASLPEIGRSFGGKHHSTVIHSIRKIEDLRQKDAVFNNVINSFLEGFR